ncbi:hypothetical protein [uncultured Algibacter sp.]|uniref:hypothetical protein n=1 Tax=uncultured Algibacter sp. TaxID=298659 RepID=UPI003217994D
MNYLKDIILTFSNEERKKFITYLDSKNKRNDAKNIKLFNLLLKDNLSASDICSKLYGSQKKDAYHALRKRLHQSVIDFTANQSLHQESSTDMQIIKCILASKSFLQQRQYKIAYKTLDKAHMLATEYQHYPLLNEIYHIKIQYAFANPNIKLDALISEFKNNQKQLFLEDELNLVYAKIRQTLNDISFKGKVIDFQTLWQTTLKEHHIDINDALSFKSLYQLITIASISAFITKDYLKIEPFLISTYKSINAYKGKNKQLYYHILILFAIANALFRNKKFKESLYYINLMHEHMLMNKSKHYNTFKLKHSLLLALNLNYSNKQLLAINTLIPFVNKKHPDTEAWLDICLSLIVFYFQKNDLDNAKKLFTKFYHTDTYYTEKAGKEWVIKKNLIEILLHIELNNIDLVESRLLSFKRQHTQYLKHINQERVLIYLSFVETYYKNPELATTKAFKDNVENSFDWIKSHKEDIFVMSFYCWLKSKMNNTNLFETTLHLVKKAQQELTIP